MNWFQFVFLREDSQEINNKMEAVISCELISICIFTWGFTSFIDQYISKGALWIDFNLYFYVRIHKKPVQVCNKQTVVNWFQFVFLREDSQENSKIRDCSRCCELISICIFTWGFTSGLIVQREKGTLWIDFNLYFYVRIHKENRQRIRSGRVVNWFQFVFLREDSQVKCPVPKALCRCELISICIFTWGFTSHQVVIDWLTLLWIDFNLYFYVRIHK